MGRHQLARKPNGDVKTHYFAFDGALNLVDAPLDTKEGMVLGAVNYEQRVRGGYRRIEGHERFDGQDSPSEQNYWILDYDTGLMETGPLTEPPVGAFFRGCTSSSFGKVIELVVLSGSWVGGDAVGYIIIANVSGTFLDNEPLSFINAGDGFNCGFSNGFG